MTHTEIREALTEVRDAVEVPPVDRVAFQQRVRTERRRRTTGRVLVAGAAAAAVATVVGVAGLGAGDERRVDVADGSGATGTVGETVFFVLDGELTALDPAGVVHDLEVAVDGVVGWTSERVFAIDDRGYLVERTVSYSDERVASFGIVDSPVARPVQTAALSGDGRYLAWTDLDAVSHRYDLKAERPDLTAPGSATDTVIDVSADGLLLFTRDGLEVRGAGSTVEVPVAEEGIGVSSQLAFGHVLVNERDGRSLLYDIRGGAADLVDTLSGFGTLGPYAERVAVSGDGWVEVWDGGTTLQLSGLEAMPDHVRWADETTLLVAAHAADGAGLWACDIELVCERLPVDGEVTLNR